jgi:tRNA A-37 threonylcarbamoyl transferase component Bud32
VTVPPGFELVAHGRLRLIVRADVRREIEPVLEAWAMGKAPVGRPLPGGRGGVRAIDLKGGLAVVLRPSRRGGLVARVNREIYLGFHPRPFQELQVTEHLRSAGVATVEVLAAAACWCMPAVYRGAVVTREMTDAVNLWEYLQRVARPARAPACVAAAEVTGQLHQAGAVHPDLNLTNYLVRDRGRRVEVAIIDCDGVQLRTVTARDRQAAFDRLCRSIRKLDPTSATITLDCVEALRAVAMPSPRAAP